MKRKFRILEVGETIKKGDQFRTSTGCWKEVRHTIGWGAIENDIRRLIKAPFTFFNDKT